MTPDRPGHRALSWPLALAVIAAVAAVSIGIRWGTFAAGGSDSYCYLGQAETFAAGRVIAVEPLGEDRSWPGTPGAFVPTGHVAAAVAGGAVPICPAGYPALMVVARAIGGRTFMFWVTPLLGGLCVYLAWVLGRSLGDPMAGAYAAALTALSPIFIYQVVQPMNDVPAAALWSVALAATLHPGWSADRRAAIAGLFSGLALTVRPNLLPLAATCGLGAALVVPGGTAVRRLRSLVVFGLAALPGVMAILAVQQAMHGSPFRSGYGDLDVLFSTSHVLPNLRWYSRWTFETQTPLVLLAFIAPFFVLAESKRRAVVLLAFVVATWACYLPYTVFDAWWYVRFLLPALGPTLVLTLAGVHGSTRRLRPAAQFAIVSMVAIALGAAYVRIARDRQAFELQRLEARFRTAGEFVATLPPEAAIVTGYQTGAVRFYSGRSSVAWGDIDPGRLGEALDFLRRHGRKPYLLFESWEEPLFKERFGGRDRLGSLEWPPMADIDRTVRVFDPDDYDRYMSGANVNTQLIRTRRR